MNVQKKIETWATIDKSDKSKASTLHDHSLHRLTSKKNAFKKVLVTRKE